MLVIRTLALAAILALAPIQAQSADAPREIPTVQVPLPVAAPAPVIVPPVPQPQQMVTPVPVAVTNIDHTQLYITTIGTILTLLITSVMTYMVAGVKAKAEIAEADRMQIKATLAASTEQASRKADETLKVANTIHHLVNNDMRIALQTAATLARRIADLTGTDTDKASADKAQKAVDDHDAGQKKLDAERAANPQARA